MNRFRRVARRLRDRAFAARAGARFARVREPRRLVLAFHNVVEDHRDTSRTDASLHLPLSHFEQLIDAVAAVPNIELARDASLAPSGVVPVQVLVTFDDAYRGAIRLALPALEARGAAAVVFVAPAILGQSRTWWDTLRPQRSRTGEAAWERERECLLAAPACGLAERIFGSNTEHTPEPDDLPHSVADDLGIATVAELAAACGSGKVRFACHSLHHACLPSLPADAIRAELQGTREWLAASGLPCLSWHAFPYGRWSDDVVQVLRELEYHAAFLIEPTHVARYGDLLHPRLNVPAGISPDGLVGQLARLLK